MSSDLAALPRLSYTREEVAAVCGVSLKTVERAHNSGALRAKRSSKDGGRYLYLVADVETWLKSLPDG